MRGTDPAVTSAVWDAIRAWDGRAAIAEVVCPTLLIVVDKPLNRPADVARLNPKVTTGQVAGAGHMIQFEVMDQVAAMMRRFLELYPSVSFR